MTREQQKSRYFGFHYSTSSRSLADRGHVSPAEAARMLNDYRQAYGAIPPTRGPRGARVKAVLIYALEVAGALALLYLGILTLGAIGAAFLPN